MDFDSPFYDCCKSCNSTSPKSRWPRAGQGDCKCSEVQDRNFWMKAPSENRFKSKILQETEEIALKKDDERRFMDPGCNCLTKTNQKQEYQLSHEAKQEKNEPDIFDNFPNIPPNSWKSKMERFYVSEERKYHTISEKLLTENILELEKKVDFLLRSLKECGHQRLNGNCFENMQTKGTATLGDTWHMFNFNRRLCAAEEGIEKLALILEELLKESCRNRGPFLPNENMTTSESSDNINPGQRFNFLKSRNSMLLSLIKTFLKSSSVEDICSKLYEEFDSQSTALRPENASRKRNQLKDSSREDLIEILENLKLDAKDTQTQVKTQNYSEDFVTKTGRREFGSKKHIGSRLEAISEQAELTLDEDEGNENSMDDFKRKNEVRNFKQIFSQVTEELKESQPELRDVTSRLLAQEAILKSSLDKAHLELFPKLSFPNSNVNFFNNSKISANEEASAGEMDLNSLSGDISHSICESKTVEKPSFSGVHHTSSKHSKREEFKKPVKEEKNSFRANSNGLCKDSSIKKLEEQLNKKNKSGCKVSDKPNNAATKSLQRSSRITYDPCLSSRKSSKHDAQTQEERPATAPMSQRKVPPSSLSKPSSPEKNSRKSSGNNNNVRLKNKILLSKKSLVQTP